MHLQLNNLNDKELLLKIRKNHDREAAGILLDRYSHLLVAVCLPQLSKDKPADQAFPALTRQLFTQLSATFGKVNETVYGMVHHYFSKDKAPFLPPPSQAIQQLETRMENAGNNPIEKEALAAALNKALDKLTEAESALITRFYLEHQSLKQIAEAQHTTSDKVRNQLKGIRKKIATHLKEQAYE